MTNTQNRITAVTVARKYTDRDVDFFADFLQGIDSDDVAGHRRTRLAFVIFGVDVESAVKEYNYLTR